MQTPDITKAQAMALVGSLIQAAVAFGVTLTQQQQDAMMGVFAVLAAIVFADMGIRRGRAKVAVEDKRNKGLDELLMVLDEDVL